MRTSLLALVALPLALTVAAACGGSKKPATDATNDAATATAAATAAPTVEPKKEEPPPPPKKTAKEVVTGGTTFMFSLADSLDAKKLATEDCEKKTKKDEAKMAECMKGVEDAAANEGCRFEKDEKAEGAWWWVSFGKDKDKEVIYNKVKFTITAETPTKLTIKPEGRDMGKKPIAKLPAEMTLEIPDETTVGMMDPKKGLLVYKAK